MATQYQHRIILVVPTAKVAAVVAWLQANIDATCPANLGPALNPTGLIANPVTHRWQCAAWTDAQCKLLLVKICQLATVTPPTNVEWASWTGAQKRSWLAGVRATVLTNYGIYISLANNAGAWDNSQSILTALNLKPITQVL